MEQSPPFVNRLATEWVVDVNRAGKRATALLASDLELKNASGTPLSTRPMVSVNTRRRSLHVGRARAVASEEPFLTALDGFARSHPVLSPDAYSELLHELGFANQHVRLQVYKHELPSRESVVEWVKGTLFTAYGSRLPPPLYEQFVDRYRTRIREELADEKPFPFFFWRGRPML